MEAGGQGPLVHAAADGVGHDAHAAGLDRHAAGERHAEDGRGEGEGETLGRHEIPPN
ncbi:hypothetical protein D3C87_2154750 [compost metagenome]